MRLLEFQAKQVFTQYGIPIPAGMVIISSRQADQIVVPAVLKVQIPVGGRGKAGGIVVVETSEEAQRAMAELFHKTIKGYPINSLLVEEKMPIRREFYLSVMFDKKVNSPIIIASASGGVDIEQVARDHPELITKSKIDMNIGLQKYTVHALAKKLGIQDKYSFSAIVEGLYRILISCDASLVEINPLVETDHGLVALDAKIILDDKAEFRHREWFDQIQNEQNELEHTLWTEAEYLAKQYGVTYVSLNGNIAMIADGAGTGMLTLDLIQDEGGQAANFCEMGGLANAKITNEAMTVVLANPNAKVLLMTLIGGMTRMDEIADGVAQYVNENGKTRPMVIRMCGTQEEAGKATLRGVGIEVYDDMAKAVQAAVAIARTV